MHSVCCLNLLHCKGKEVKLAGVGQDNKVSRDMCRDMSYLITREIKKKKLGLFTKVIIPRRTVKVLVLFIGNTNLVADGLSMN